MSKEEKSQAILLGLFEIIKNDHRELNQKGRDLEAATELADVAALLTSWDKQERETGKKMVRLCVATYQRMKEAAQIAEAANRFEPQE